MAARVGTPLQAIKFMTTQFNDPHVVGVLFVKDWLSGALFNGRFEATLRLFEKFCSENPDEPERADGRKLHYGEGRQPVDAIRELGWAPEFFAGNVLKYLRRDKAPEHSLKSARVYYSWLQELAHVSHVDDAGYRARNVLFRLDAEMTEEELRRLAEEKS